MKIIYTLVIILVCAQLGIGRTLCFTDEELKMYWSDSYKCEQDRSGCIYTYSVVKDSVFMDKIIAAVNETWTNDSIYNLITTEYSDCWLFEWNRNKKWKYCDIWISQRQRTKSEFINDKFLTEDFDKNALNNPIITITVIYSYFSPPTGKFYTNYKGNTYYFSSKAIITPTKKTKIEMDSSKSAFELFFAHVYLFFVYDNGKIYLDPDKTTWWNE
ncbi:MAG: hypothetical protein K2M68_08350 [Muribaculaceae bacterium]|nr:hypothetical protein [Muribaculaceae bacterium]